MMSFATKMVNIFEKEIILKSFYSTSIKNIQPHTILSYNDDLVFVLDLKPKIMGSETTYNTIFIGKTLFIFCAYEDCNTPATVTWFKVTNI